MKNLILHACWTALTPIIRLLLHNGVTYKEFANLSKAVFVDVAAKDFGIGGRPTNTTRIAILTGMDRKTIKEFREEGKNFNISDKYNKTDRITRVLTGWHKDPDFMDENGEPKALSFFDAEPNLNSLLRRYGGDVQPTALLKELRRVEVVEEVSENRWKASKRNYISVTADPETLARALHTVGDVAANMHHNLYVSSEKTPKKLERRVTNPNIPAAVLPAFRTFVDIESQKYLEILDAWLNEHEINPDENHDVPVVRTGLGIYWIERNENNEKFN